MIRCEAILASKAPSFTGLVYADWKTVHASILVYRYTAVDCTADHYTAHTVAEPSRESS